MDEVFKHYIGHIATHTPTEKRGRITEAKRSANGQVELTMVGSDDKAITGPQLDFKMDELPSGPQL